MRVLGFALAAFGLLALSAHADTQSCLHITSNDACTVTLGELQDGKVAADDLKIKMNSPTVPAGAILGDDDLALTTVRTFSDLTPQILGSFNNNFELQPGLAVGGAPYWWGNPKETLKEYQDNRPWVRILKRTQFGLATKQAPSDGAVKSTNTLVGASLGWQLLDQQDVRSKYYQNEIKCLTDAMEGDIRDAIFKTSDTQTDRAVYAVLAAHPEFKRDPKLPNPIPDQLTPEWFETDPGRADARYLILLAAFRDLYANALANPQESDSDVLKKQSVDLAAYKKAREGCSTKFSKRMADSASLTLNVATAYVAEGGKLSDLDPQKTSVWVSYKSMPVKFIGAPILGFLNYNSRETVTLPNKTQVKADRFTVALGTSYDIKDNASLDFQVSYIRSDFQGPTPSDDEYRVSLSYSRKINDNVWLEIKAGRTNADSLKDASFAGIGLKVDWAAMLGGK